MKWAVRALIVVLIMCILAAIGADFENKITTNTITGILWLTL